MSRTTKLTPEIQERIGEALRIGATHKHAAAHGGISETTFYEWLNRNPAFAEFIRAREAEGALSLMALINHAAQHDDWRAAAWILEHRWPDDYAVNRIDIHHSGEVKLNMDLLSDLRTVVEQLFPHDAVIQERLADALAEVDQKQPLTLPSPRNRTPRTTRKERE